MACQPKGSLELDFEKEERYLLAAMGGAGKDTVYDSCDLGTYDELEERIDSFQPHIVHLIGHGVVRDGQGWFAFEDEDGDEDLRPSSDIGQLFAGSGVQCAFVSGCQTGKAPERASLGGICQGLVRQGVPIAIGWAASIADSVAGRLAETFYNRVAGGQPDGQAGRAGA